MKHIEKDKVAHWVEVSQTCIDLQLLLLLLLTWFQQSSTVIMNFVLVIVFTPCLEKRTYSLL